jgi:hypothetical protein
LEQCARIKKIEKKIINNLREADNRANEALEKRDLAKAQLQEAQSEQRN